MTRCLAGHAWPHEGTHHLPFPTSDDTGRGEGNRVPVSGCPQITHHSRGAGEACYPHTAPYPAGPPWDSHWDPGQVWVGRRNGQDPPTPLAPQAQSPVLRLTHLLPARQLSSWDLSVCLSHGPLLRKQEEVGGSRGSSAARGSWLRTVGGRDQEEGQVDSRATLQGETQPCFPGAEGPGPWTRHRAAGGVGEPWTLPWWQPVRVH